MGLTLDQFGRSPESRAHLLRALLAAETAWARAPDDPRVREHLALAHHHYARIGYAASAARAHWEANEAHRRGELQQHPLLTLQGR